MTSSSIEAIIGEALPGLAQAAGVGPGSGNWFQKLMPSSPHRNITIWVYQTSRNPITRCDTYAVQLRGRGLPDDTLDVDELMNPVADWFCSLEHVDLPGPVPVHIDQVLFRSSAPMGTDGDNRTERADTFDLTVTPPATYRRFV